MLLQRVNTQRSELHVTAKIYALKWSVHILNVQPCARSFIRPDLTTSLTLYAEPAEENFIMENERGELVDL